MDLFSLQTLSDDMVSRAVLVLGGGLVGIVVIMIGYLWFISYQERRAQEDRY